MTHRQQRNSISSRSIAGVIVIGVGANLAGCTANPVFEHRFSHCMNAWNTQEAPDTTVYPKGESTHEYCWGWARQNLPTVAITPKPQQPNASALKEQGG